MGFYSEEHPVDPRDTPLEDIPHELTAIFELGTMFSPFHHRVLIVSHLEFIVAACHSTKRSAHPDAWVSSVRFVTY